MEKYSYTNNSYSDMPVNIDNYYHIYNEYFDKPIEFGDIYLVQLGRISCKGGAIFPPHVPLNRFELTVVTGGKGTVGANGKNVDVKEGDVFLSLPSDVHVITSDAENPLKYDFFAFYTVNEQLNSELNHICVKFREPEMRLFSDSVIASQVALCIAEFANKNSFLTENLTKNIVQQIVVYLIRNFQNKRTLGSYINLSSADTVCYNLMNYIDTHIFSIKNLNEIAEATNYNYSYLSSLFKKTTGQTLSKYYHNCKLRTAKKLIEENRMKISEVAEFLNYSSIYVFSRAYKNKYGFSPKFSKKNEKTN